MNNIYFWKISEAVAFVAPTFKKQYAISGWNKEDESIDNDRLCTSRYISTEKDLNFI